MCSQRIPGRFSQSSHVKRSPTRLGFRRLKLTTVLREQRAAGAPGCRAAALHANAASSKANPARTEPGHPVPPSLPLSPACRSNPSRTPGGQYSGMPRRGVTRQRGGREGESPGRNLSLPQFPLLLLPLLSLFPFSLPARAVAPGGIDGGTRAALTAAPRCSPALAVAPGGQASSGQDLAACPPRRRATPWRGAQEHRPLVARGEAPRRQRWCQAAEPTTRAGGRRHLPPRPSVLRMRCGVASERPRLPFKSVAATRGAQRH